MKKMIKASVLLLVSVILSVSFSSCSKDDDDEPEVDGGSIGQVSGVVGTWSQTNSYGTVIDVTFSANNTGSITYTYPSGSQSVEFFEYKYKVDSDGDETINILSDDCQLAGEYDVVITPSMITLSGYSSSGYVVYQFKRK